MYIVQTKCHKQKCDSIMHPRPPGRHLEIDSWPTTNFEFWAEIFLFADMFPYEDSKTVSVRLSIVCSPRKEITLALSISVLEY